MTYCMKCIGEKKEEENKILQELGYSKRGSVRELLRYLRDGGEGLIKDKVLEHIKKRVGGDEPGDHISVQDANEDLSDGILPEDIESVLEKYMDHGYLELEEGKIRITQKGGRKLADLARLKLENLLRKGNGTHKIKDEGSGLELASFTRKYEYGNSYAHIHIQKTLLNSLARNAFKNNIPHSSRGKKTLLSLDREDFVVYEKRDDSRVSMALLVDESGSMGEEKRNAAIETCLALASAKRKGDTLKVILYSAQIKEIPYWEILNRHFPGSTTDITIALQAGRRTLRGEKGNKQVYLITDNEPNTENGKYVGFEKALSGVRKEVLQYRKEGVTLNIMMLGERPQLKDFASELAKINAGRVFFTSSDNLGRVVIEDYLKE